MAPALSQELIALLEPLAQSNGLDLVTVETVGGPRNLTVRVYLDRDGGIDIEAIAEANGWISDALDGVARLSGSFTLEVSSPGIERALRKRTDFERFAGSTVVIQSTAPVNGRSRFTGTLTGIEADDVVLEIDGEERRVPFGQVERARLKADFG